MSSPLSDKSEPLRARYHDEALQDAADALAGVLMECCTVEQCEDTLAPIHPDDWRKAAERAIDTYERRCVEIAKRDFRRAMARVREEASRVTP